jgi:hypothetical protein
MPSDEAQTPVVNRLTPHPATPGFPPTQSGPFLNRHHQWSAMLSVSEAPLSLSLWSSRRRVVRRRCLIGSQNPRVAKPDGYVSRVCSGRKSDVSHFTVMSNLGYRSGMSNNGSCRTLSAAGRWDCCRWRNYIYAIEDSSCDRGSDPFDDDICHGWRVAILYF